MRLLSGLKCCNRIMLVGRSNTFFKNTDISIVLIVTLFLFIFNLRLAWIPSWAHSYWSENDCYSSDNDNILRNIQIFKPTYGPQSSSRWVWLENGLCLEQGSTLESESQEFGVRMRVNFSEIWDWDWQRIFSKFWDWVK